jgi:energy-coupling factor transport system ATP-binding protein
MLTAHQISYRYPQNNHGLASITLDIAPGEFVLITGSSGSGKSTLARCMMGLIPHLYHGNLTGEIWLNGNRTVDLQLWQIAEKAGMVFQNPAAQMLTPSVEDEIVFGLENLGLEVDEISRRLNQAINLFGLESLRDRNPQTLSGGEQQKLALAAIVARQPPVLILDEPLSMLDSSAAEALIQHLIRLSSAGKTIVVFEHRDEYLQAVPGLRTIAINGSPQKNTDLRPGLDLPSSDPFQIKIEGVTVQFGNQTPLNNLDLSLSGGQLVAIVGRNGVGKTTLLRVLAGMQKHTGQVSITPEKNGPPSLGLVFQNPDLQLFNGSVRDEILYRLPDPDMAHYETLIAALGLTNYEDTPPLLLSEGEKKRLALALVLMAKPHHGLLLDEPSLGQDLGQKQLLMQILKSITDAGRLTVMTTHDLQLASQADRLIILDSGGVLADGPPQKIISDRAVWATAGINLPAWFQVEQRELLS